MRNWWPTDRDSECRRRLQGGGAGCCVSRSDVGGLLTQRPIKAVADGRATAATGPILRRNLAMRNW
ncbi:protein of unknown function [Rhodovastum atsumiense]|nr:protein of unknown function [Rhodovastum atsumiense]